MELADIGFGEDFGGGKAQTVGGLGSEEWERKLLLDIAFRGQVGRIGRKKHKKGLERWWKSADTTSDVNNSKPPLLIL